MCQTNAIEDKNYQTGLQSGLGEVGSSKRLDCKEERTGKPTPPAPAKVSTEAKQAIPAPAVVRPAPRPKPGTSLCAPGSRKPDCRACKEDNKCQPAKFPSAETPKTPEVGKVCPKYATKDQVKAKIAARKGIHNRSNGVINEKMRKFEYFRGINETPLQPHPQKRQDSGAGGTKRKLFEAPVSTDGDGGKTAASTEPPSSPTKKAKTAEAEKSDQILKVLHAESYQIRPLNRVSTDETQSAGVTSDEYKQACVGVYLGGTYPYAEFLVDEPSLRDAVNNDDSDATLPYTDADLDEIAEVYGCDEEEEDEETQPYVEDPEEFRKDWDEQKQENNIETEDFFMVWHNKTKDERAEELEKRKKEIKARALELKALREECWKLQNYETIKYHLNDRENLRRLNKESKNSKRRTEILQCLLYESHPFCHKIKGLTREAAREEFKTNSLPSFVSSLRRCGWPIINRTLEKVNHGIKGKCDNSHYIGETAVYYMDEDYRLKYHAEREESI
jgi:hypothetical protein